MQARRQGEKNGRRLGSSNLGGSEGSSGLFVIVLQDAVKLLYQVGELCGVFFLNDGLSEVLPCFAGVSRHR
jgi:hypothetical protein